MQRMREDPAQSPANACFIHHGRGIVSSASALVISLDFEMFWGVLDSQTVAGYGGRVAGEWTAIPHLLKSFQRHGIRATWATVGMVMCRDHRHWSEIHPETRPGYLNPACDSYRASDISLANPELFFGRPLVEAILATPGQEIGSHSYSHFYCGEPGATPSQFAADLACACSVANDLQIDLRSFVFPRNMVLPEFLGPLEQSGFKVWRGNPRHPLFRNGHTPPGGPFGRALRLADAWVPLSGSNLAQVEHVSWGVDVPASCFLRPWHASTAALESLRLQRITKAMTEAAEQGGIFHLWWHPHNFGLDQARNLAFLEQVLRHFQGLRDDFGMESRCMGDFAPEGAE